MMKQNITQDSVFLYQGTNITFQKGNNVMVNATEMAKAFGKRPVDWLQNQSAQEFIQALTEVRKSTSADLVQVMKGGIEQGTWMHEDVALEFARWLSPAFAIWCNDRIKELLTTGVTTMSNDDEAILHAMQVLQRRVEESKHRIQTLEAKDQFQQAVIAEHAPKVLFAQAVETSKRSCLVSELAKILQQNGVQIGQNRLFVWLREHGYLCQKGQMYNQPTQRAMELGLFELKQTTINKPDGSVLVNTTTKVTGKGQIYFVDKFLSIRSKIA